MSVILATGPNGFPKLMLSHPAGSSAEVYLHGAHVTSWVPLGMEESLFLSSLARFEKEQAIRGGVPVIFPQFADLGPLSKHGFARVMPWQWVEQTQASETRPRAVLQLDASDETVAIWPHAFRARLAVELGENQLSLALSIYNTDAQPFSFNAALHTYLRVADVRHAAVRGLQGVYYRDRTAEGEVRQQSAPELTLSGEVDRLYLDAPSVVEVADNGNKRLFTLRAERFSDVVVWNPWKEGAAAMADLPEDAYRHMLCVEGAQVGEAITLQPGESWQGAQHLIAQPAG